jgi:hypothetical protein
MLPPFRARTVIINDDDSDKNQLFVLIWCAPYLETAAVARCQGAPQQKGTRW